MSKAPPRTFGAKSNAHQIVIRDSSKNGTVTHRERFEQQFNSTDRHVPEVIYWLQSLERVPSEDSLNLEDRFHEDSAPNDKLQNLLCG